MLRTLSSFGGIGVQLGREGQTFCLVAPTEFVPESSHRGRIAATRVKRSSAFWGEKAHRDWTFRHQTRIVVWSLVDLKVSLQNIYSNNYFGLLTIIVLMGSASVAQRRTEIGPAPEGIWHRRSFDY